MMYRAILRDLCRSDGAEETSGVGTITQAVTWCDHRLLGFVTDDGMSGDGGALDALGRIHDAAGPVAVTFNVGLVMQDGRPEPERVYEVRIAEAGE